MACMRSAKDDDTVRPILLTLYQATDVTVQNIKMINGPEWINFVCRLATLFVLSTRLIKQFNAAGQRGEEHRLPQHHDLRRVDVLARREEHGRVGHLPERQRHHRGLRHQQWGRLCQLQTECIFFIPSEARDGFLMRDCLSDRRYQHIGVQPLLQWLPVSQTACI